MPTATKAAQNGAAATDTTAAQVIETVAAALPPTNTVADEIVTHTTVAVESAAGKAHELSDGFTATVKKAAGLTVDAYHQAGGLYLGDPTAWV